MKKLFVTLFLSTLLLTLTACAAEPAPDLLCEGGQTTTQASCSVCGATALCDCAPTIVETRETPCPVCSATFLCNCLYTPHPNDTSDVDYNTAFDLRMQYESYLRANGQLQNGLSINDIWVKNYYGQIEGCHIVKMGHEYPVTPAERQAVIAGCLLTFPDSERVYLCDGTRFYTLEEAYDTKVITRDGLIEICHLLRRLNVLVEFFYPVNE